MRTCRICRDKFDPVRAMQPTCQRYACQVAYAEKAAGKSAEKRKAEIRKDIRQHLYELVELRTAIDLIRKYIPPEEA